GGDGLRLELVDLNTGAISASDSITLAVGTGGQVDFSEAAGQILQAGRLLVAADTIILPKGSSLSDFASADVEQEQSRIIYGVGLVGPESVVGRPGDTVSLTLLVANLSPKSDSFSFDLSDAAGW